MAKSILTISQDGRLLDLRNAVLERAGYHVSSARSMDEAIQYLPRLHLFDLVVFCHSIPEESRVFLAAQIKHFCPRLPILFLSRGSESTEAAVDAVFHSLDSPRVWLREIDSLTGSPALCGDNAT